MHGFFIWGKIMIILKIFRFERWRSKEFFEINAIQVSQNNELFLFLVLLYSATLNG